ncbi:MAG: 50S ribosomal protein L11 methyltransferase [Paludibacteraceae bacterium]|nr:50S ribosomal protein L11 methyltransferase [Paludibacteraceae bacterium]
MEYIKVTFRTEDVEEWANDLLASMLGEVGFESFEETSRGIIGYCPAPAFDEAAMKQTVAELPIADTSLIAYRIETIADQNWNAVWEQNGYEPIEISSECIIHASNKEVSQGYKYDIIINPVQSFGSGYHETTRMILTYLLDMDIDDKAVLDMGCGTGVLGILACLRGAGSLVAVDIDEWSWRNAIENIEANDIEGAEVVLGDASQLADFPNCFDIVLANINRNILLNDMEAYVGTMTDKAQLIISGFYLDDLDMIRQKAESLGLHYLDHKTDNDWTAVRFQR